MSEACKSTKRPGLLDVMVLGHVYTSGRTSSKHCSALVQQPGSLVVPLPHYHCRLHVTYMNGSAFCVCCCCSCRCSAVVSHV